MANFARSRDIQGIILQRVHPAELPDGPPHQYVVATEVPPRSVIVRGSSGGVALDDPELIAAVRFIRDNAGRGVTVAQVADHALLSRRTPERRFEQCLSRTIRDQIRSAKVGRAKRLLVDTDLPYAEVAERSRLVQQQQMSRLVKAATGPTPAQCRKSSRDRRTA